MSRGKVLVLAEYGWRNGGENSLLAVVPGLRQLGWEFVFACPAETELAQYLAQLEIPQIDWTVLDDNGVRMPQADIRHRISDFLADQQPDILHCNSLSTGRLAGPVAAASKVSSLGYLRDILKLSRRAISDLNHLDQIVAVSCATRDFHVAHGLAAEKLEVVYNGIDLEKFKPRRPTGFLHNELNIERNAQLILCVGQIGLRKGTDTVIRSFLRLCDQQQNRHLLLIGMRNSQKQESIDYEIHCHQISHESKFKDHVHWLGRRTDIDQIFNEACLLLHGAREEPLGRVLLEASASGCPFVATDVGGTAEIVGDCYRQFTLCPVDSVEEMTQAASQVLNDREKWQSIGQCLRQNAKNQFEDGRCVADLNTIYQRLASEI